MKYFKTLKEARAYIKGKGLNLRNLDWYRLKAGKVYKYVVCTEYEWYLRYISH